MTTMEMAFNEAEAKKETKQKPRKRTKPVVEHGEPVVETTESSPWWKRTDVISAVAVTAVVAVTVGVYAVLSAE